jgi:hypothetical protein
MIKKNYMKTKLLTLAIVWLFANTVYAQKENNIWYFGNQAGLDFNSGSPVALTDGMTNTVEGCASISDANGSLLFYTDGITVWDRIHTQMPNGFGLGGGLSSTQSALIVPFPGNNLMYYIFTVEDASSGNFSFSVVDMSLNGGNGDVTIKNSFLLSSVAEKLTAVKNANNTGMWVMVHEKNNDAFYAYLVTSAGVSAAPVVSNAGQSLSGMVIGQMKFSPDGLKIAFVPHMAYADLFDFNAATGVVSNEIYLTNISSSSYGVEFSSNGKYLYGADYGNIYQWDITSNNAATINASWQTIGSSSGIIGSLQYGPDGKIYAAKYNASSLSVINNPDSAGLACNYVDNAVSLAGKMCQLGLPNYITSDFLPTGISNLQPPINYQISPNPATDKITISFAATTSENISVKIYSITGEVVFEEENKIGTNYFNKPIDVTGFSNGIYFLSVQTGREVVTKKIVVQH